MCMLLFQKYSFHLLAVVSVLLFLFLTISVILIKERLMCHLREANADTSADHLLYNILKTFFLNVSRRTINMDCGYESKNIQILKKLWHT